MPQIPYPNNYDDDFVNITKMLIDIINDQGVKILSEEGIQQAITQWLSDNEFKPKEAVSTFADLPSAPELKEIRGVLDENAVYVYDGTNWLMQTNINFNGLGMYEEDLNQTKKKMNTEKFLLFEGYANDETKKAENSALLLSLIEQDRPIKMVKDEYFFGPIALPTNLKEVNIDGNGSIIWTDGGDLFSATSRYHYYMNDLEIYSTDQYGRAFDVEGAAVFKFNNVKVKHFEYATKATGDMSTSDFRFCEISENYHGIDFPESSYFTNFIDSKLQRNAFGLNMPKGRSCVIERINVFPVYRGRDSETLDKTTIFNLGSGTNVRDIWIEEYGLDVSKVEQFKIDHPGFDALPVVMDMSSIRFENELGPQITVNTTRNNGDYRFDKKTLLLNNVNNSAKQRLKLKSDNERLVRGVVIDGKNYTATENFTVFNETEYRINASSCLKAPASIAESVTYVPLGYTTSDIEGYSKFVNIATDSIYSEYEKQVTIHDDISYEYNFIIQAEGMNDGLYDVGVVYRNAEGVRKLIKRGTLSVSNGSGVIIATGRIPKHVTGGIHRPISVAFLNTRTLPVDADYANIKLEGHIRPSGI